MTEGRHDASPLTLERYLRDLPFLDVAQLLEISAAHNGTDRESLERARAAAGRVARAEGLLDELHELHGTIVQWVGAQNSYSGMWTRETAFDNPVNRVLHDSREQARAALLDGATALYLEDRLPPEDRETLLGPVGDVLAG